MAIAYLLCKASAKFLKVNFSIPLILVLSVLPDIDILFARALLNPEIHRGPTHSIITATIAFVPFFLLYRHKAIPYFAALASHSLIGDFVIGGQLQLLWPLSASKFGFPNIKITDPTNIALEFTLFAIAILVMLKGRDILSFFKNSKINFILILPICTVLLPTFLSYPLQVPTLLILPHLFFLVLFSISVLIALRNITK